MDHGLMLESAYFAILIISLIAYKSRIKSIKENNEKYAKLIKVSEITYILSLIAEVLFRLLHLDESTQSILHIILYLLLAENTMLVCTLSLELNVFNKRTLIR